LKEDQECMSLTKEPDELLDALPPQAGKLAAIAQRVQPDASASMPVKGSLFGPQRGIVTGYWELGERHDYRPDEVFVLPEDARATIPGGQRITVLVGAHDDSGNVWQHLDLPQDATMIGPLVWGWGHPREFDVQSALIDATKKDLEKTTGKIGDDVFAAGVCFSAGVTAIAAFATGDLGAGHLSIAGFGILLSFFGAMASRHWYPARTGEQQRIFQEILKDKATKRYHVYLPAKYESLVNYLSRAAHVNGTPQRIDALNESLAQAISSYEATYLQTKAETGLDGADRALLRHTKKLVGEISSNILSSAHLRNDDDLREDFLDLIGRAEAELKRVLQAKQVDETQSVKNDIEALKAQIEKYSAAA
jgi:hypothetical protein